MCSDPRSSFFCPRHIFDLFQTEFKRVAPQSQAQAEFFKCQLCSGLLTMPLTCTTCKVNFCTYCVSNKLLQMDNCPNCFEKRPRMVKMQKNLAHSLNRIKVSCKVVDGLETRGCDQVVRLGDFSRHRQTECASKCEECEEQRTASKNKVADEIPPKVRDIDNNLARRRANSFEGRLLQVPEDEDWEG